MPVFPLDTRTNSQHQTLNLVPPCLLKATDIHTDASIANTQQRKGAHPTTPDRTRGHASPQLFILKNFKPKTKVGGKKK